MPFECKAIFLKTELAVWCVLPMESHHRFLNHNQILLSYTQPLLLSVSTRQIRGRLFHLATSLHSILGVLPRRRGFPVLSCSRAAWSRSAVTVSLGLSFLDSSMSYRQKELLHKQVSAYTAVLGAPCAPGVAQVKPPTSKAGATCGVGQQQQ